MKMWRDIEKRYKIVFYLAISVFYILIMGNIYPLEYNLEKIPILSTFFIIAILGYFSRSKFEGALIGFIIWTPLFVYINLNFTKIFPYLHYHGAMEAFGILIGYLLFTIFGVLIGALLGSIGSKRGKDTRVGR